MTIDVMYMYSIEANAIRNVLQNSGLRPTERNALRLPTPSSQQKRMKP